MSGIKLNYNNDKYQKTKYIYFVTGHKKIYFESSDKKLCKILGLIQNKKYEVNNQIIENK